MMWSTPLMFEISHRNKSPVSINAKSSSCLRASISLKVSANCSQNEGYTMSILPINLDYRSLGKSSLNGKLFSIGVSSEYLMKDPVLSKFASSNDAREIKQDLPLDLIL